MEYDDFYIYRLELAIDQTVTKERDRAVMKRRLRDGICFEPLAAEFDLSVSTVKRIVGKWTDKVMKQLGDSKRYPLFAITNDPKLNLK